MVLTPNTYYFNGQFYKPHPVHTKYAASITGDILNTKKEIIETPVKIRKTPAINIYVKNGANRSFPIARLVWEAFYGPVSNLDDIAGKMVYVVHDNGNLEDNRLINLKI